MSDVVPPGGDRPLDELPWPDSQPVASTAAIRLPDVPRAEPGAPPSPPDWRTLSETGGFAPPGYRSASGPPVHVLARRDTFGIAACVIGVLGLAQILAVTVPVLSALAAGLAASGARAARLDPDGIGRPAWSWAGLAIGAVGVVFGLTLVLNGTILPFLG